MDVQTTVIDIIDNLFMEDISDMMDEDLFDAGVLDSMGTVELVIELEEKFNIKIPVSDMGRVLVNGNAAKPAKQLKVGDIIEIEYANRIEKVEVLIVPTGNVSVQDADKLYRILE